MTGKIKKQLLLIKQELYFAWRKRQIARRLTPKQTAHLKQDIAIPKSKWYGNSYGGFYACASMLHRESIVYSIGIGRDISFDTAILRQTGCQIYAYDPTPASIRYMEQQPPLPSFHFSPYGISHVSGKAIFYPPADQQAVSGSLVPTQQVNVEAGFEVSLFTLSDLMHQNNHHKLDLLKIDIEGAEYRVIPQILESGVVIDQILIEFHDRMMPGDSPASVPVVQALRNAGYLLFAHSMHYEEISFIHQSACHSYQRQRGASPPL